MECPHHAERRNQRGWDGKRSYDHGPPVATEQKHHEARQNTPDDQMDVDLVKSGVNESGLVFKNLYLNVGRELRGDLSQTLLNTRDDFHGVRARLAPDFQ